MRWIQPEEVPPEVIRELSGYSPVETQILYMRGISTSAEARHFLDKNPGEDHDPFLMRGMERAIGRIKTALKQRERIVIYGDFDADGVTSTVLLMEILRKMGGQVDYYIPDRFSEGYGLNAAALSRIAEDGAGLIISVDCGIRDVELIGNCAKEGMDIIVIDHHEPGRDLPPAVAVVNPRQEGDTYPFKSLAGVGLAFKVAQALSNRLNDGSVDDVLDLVALGTVADVVRLRGENRHLAARGIERLNSTTRPGLVELLKIARIQEGGITSSTIGFIIGPRLNAAGRLGSAARAVRLLSTSDEEQAQQLANALDRVNRERQDLTEKAVAKAIEYIESKAEEPSVILVAQEEFSEGVVGLVASRLKDLFHRPAFIGSKGPDLTRGSARSIPGFNVAEVLEECRDILLKYGGHERAGGFTLASNRLSEFEERLAAIAEERLDEEDYAPKLEIDAEVCIADLGEELMGFLDLLEPCGEGNRAPVLMTQKVYLADKRMVGAEGKHLKLVLKKAGRTMDAIAFRKGHLAPELPEFVDVAYRLERNRYMGISSLQMNLVDLRW